LEVFVNEKRLLARRRRHGVFPSAAIRLAIVIGGLEFD
jgi:hypothetical protein